jgi:GTP-binding protein EngB required for normal cell division
LVDLPGYGFAYAKEEIKDAWDDLVSILTSFFIHNFVVDYSLL